MEDEILADLLVTLAPAIVYLILEITHLVVLKEMLIVHLIRALREEIFKVVKEISGEEGNLYCGLIVSLPIAPIFILIIYCLHCIFSNPEELIKNIYLLGGVIVIVIPVFFVIHFINHCYFSYFDILSD